ncbi:MAG: Ribonuclease HII [Parcubacteria bacterium OLB19]|nr:MAG: Ribonuclease HII [Parcubacteria bacterium OLB19]
MSKWLIGIDEVGRGPLAGPVGVGVVLVSSDFDWDTLKGVKDSKKMTPKNREAIFRQTEILKQNKILNYQVELVEAKIIDKIGIVPAISQAMNTALNEIANSTPNFNVQDVVIKLDGGLKASKEYINQETIVKGDDKEIVIGLASIMAKVTRDKYMENIAEQSNFTVYNFQKHKGYGTKAHREAILEHGLSVEHRLSFCKNILNLQKSQL